MGKGVMSEEARQRLSAERKGAGNPMYGRTREQSSTWKNEPGYRTVHARLAYFRTKTGCCEYCGDTHRALDAGKIAA